MAAAVAAAAVAKTKKKRNAMEYEKIMLKHLLRNVIIPERVCVCARVGQTSTFLIPEYTYRAKTGKREENEELTARRKWENEQDDEIWCDAVGPCPAVVLTTMHGILYTYKWQHRNDITF